MIKVLEKLKYINNGGIEAFVFGTLENFSDKTEADVFSDNPPQTSKFSDNATFKIYSPDRSCSFRLKPIRMFAKMTALTGFVKNNHYDVIHIHMCRPYDAMYAVAARLGGNKRILLHSHFSRRNDELWAEKLLNAFFKKISRITASEFAACSEQAAEYMFGTKKFVLLKNGIDTSRFAFDAKIRKAERERLGIGDCFAVGNVGRLAPLKNHTFLLDVFAELLKLLENSVLVIAGDGGLSESLNQKADALGISDKVMFLGSVDNVSPLYQALDCFVFPSLSEGLGIAAVEAQTSGLVTVCSDGVPKEAGITELCSFMPLSASPKEWAEHIISRTSEYERKSYADEVRAAGYDIQDTAKQLEKIYLSLAEE